MFISPKTAIFALLSLSITGFSVASCSKSSPSAKGPTEGAGGQGVEGSAKVPVGFIHAEGRHLIDEEGDAVLLHGVAFGNQVWSGLATPPSFHHNERDYERLRSMGMNAIRFYLNYQLFESDDEPYVYRQEGFDWLDKNIAWAKKHGVVLLVNMHYPPGGFQSNGEGAALWESEENQNRLTLLWKEIAKRYKDEPTIAGLDFLNEPRPTQSLSQWSELANHITREVRSVNDKTMIVVERALTVADDWDLPVDDHYFLVDDDNVLYQFHFYSPIEYTHQNASWTDFGDGGKYPDESIISSANAVWEAWSWTPVPPILPVGDSEWTYYESVKYSIEDPEHTIVQPVMVSELNSGTAFFDEMVVKEYDKDGNFVRNVIEDSLDSEAGYNFWKEGENGSFSVSEDCHQGKCFVIDNTDHDSNLQNPQLRFLPKKDHTYSVGGYMKGIATADDSRPDPRGDWTQSSRALFRLDYFHADGPVFSRGKEALGAELDALMHWGIEHDVPLYLGEFGVISNCYENGKGGLTWVSDMLDLSIERKLNFTFHSYHEPNFGIYLNDSSQSLPEDNDAVPGLIELFQEKLGK